MYYNLNEFGKEISSIRNNLNLSQKSLSTLSNVHVDTLRKIENGKVTPTQVTLDILSIVLKTDLNTLFLTYRLNNYLQIKEIINKVESKFDQDKYETLCIELDQLKKLVNSESSTYFINQISQLILLMESVILNKKHNETNISMNKLKEAMLITIPNFSLNDYKTFSYNPMEIRIMMNIALLINKITSTEQSLEIMKFCISTIDSNNKLYPKLCYNLSYTYHRLDINKQALKYANLGIKYCTDHRHYNGLNLLYFRKGIAEYKLQYKNYMESLDKSIFFCEIVKQNDLKQLLIDNCFKFYKIIIRL